MGVTEDDGIRGWTIHIETRLGYWQEPGMRC